MNRESLYKLIGEVEREKKFRNSLAEKVLIEDVEWAEGLPKELVATYDRAVEEYKASLTQVMDQALTYLVDGKGRYT